MTKRGRIFTLVGIAASLAWLNLRYPAPGELVMVSKRSAALNVNGNVLAGNQRQLPGALPTPRPVEAPGAWSRPVLDPAERDPFGMAMPKPAVVAVQAPVAAPAQVVAPPITPPAPTPPPVNMSFAGRMTAPDGSQIVYVAFGDISLAITTGQDLPNGYRVEAITARSVELRYPPLNSTARLDLPEPPKYETR